MALCEHALYETRHTVVPTSKGELGNNESTECEAAAATMAGLCRAEICFCLCCCDDVSMTHRVPVFKLVWNAVPPTLWLRRFRRTVLIFAMYWNTTQNIALVPVHSAWPHHGLWTVRWPFKYILPFASKFADYLDSKTPLQGWCVEQAAKRSEIEYEIYALAVTGSCHQVILRYSNVLHCCDRSQTKGTAIWDHSKNNVMDTFHVAEG